MKAVEQKFIKKKILLSGWIDLGPIGRHGLSFINTLKKDPRNEIWLDSDYVEASSLAKIIDDMADIRFTNGKYQEFDFLIYFHVLGITPNDEWYDKALLKNSKIKICYPVFDGTVPPLEWVEKINSNFDICCSPSEYVSHNLRRWGVTIDCFGLECCVLIENILKCKQKKTNKFRFGCISGNEARKNLKFLVKSFAETFSKNEPVELFIHSCDRPNLLTPYNELLDAVEEANKRSNVILHSDFVSQKDMDDIWSSFDAYVIPQRNTGYYTTPLEGLACGLPIILSDIPVHQELAKHIQVKDSLFFAPHPLYVPEFHFVFDYRNIGVSFASSHENYKKYFREIYEKRNILNSQNLVEERKKSAKLFLPENLSKKHNIIIHPSKIALAKTVSHLDADGTFFMSEKLAKKYEAFGFGKFADVKDLYQETIYPEEQDPVFQALERTAVESQKIWLKLYEKRNLVTPQYGINDSKWMKKLLRRSETSGVTRLPRFIYKAFSLYCKTKTLFKRKKH